MQSPPTGGMAVVDKTNEPDAQPVPASSTGYNKRWYIYSSYFFCSFGDRTWEFASVVFMMELFPGTLLYAALFGLLEAVTGILSGPTIGTYIDSHDRLHTIRTALVGQDLSIAAASCVYFLALTVHVESYARTAVYIGLVACAIVARISSSMAKVSLNKDWIVALCGTDSQKLSYLNASTRRIDLSCSIAAPLIVGLLSSFASPATAIAIIGIWNFCSLPVEYKLAQWVYRSVCELQTKKDVQTKAGITAHANLTVALEQPTSTSELHNISEADATKHTSTTFEQDPILHIEYHVTHLRSAHRSLMRRLQLWYHTNKYSWKAYYNHPSFMASLAYCFTYLSIINFGSQMTAYLKTVDFSDFALAGGRAVGVGHPNMRLT